MINQSKTDPILGLKIHEYLKKKGVETPLKSNPLSTLTHEEKIEILTDHFTSIWEVLGLDLSDDSLKDTPKRMAKMYLNEIYYGLKPENFPKCTAVDNKMGYDEMVIVNDITVSSNCEHHGVVIDGLAKVAYIPRDKVLGLSKINRVVEYFSKRPQIQERLTEQIYHALSFILRTDDVAVSISATHYCVKSRGVEDVNSYTTTNKLGGSFKDKPEVRMEFLK